MTEILSYPLHWPAEYGRAPLPKNSRFRGYSLFDARERLRDSIRLLDGKQLIISTNIRTRQDGDIYSNAAEPSDSGVAIYFQLNENPVCLCCDQYRKVWENTYAIYKTIEAMRGIDRWGVSDMLNRMFTGFKALPDPEELTPEEFLRLPEGWDKSTLASRIMAAHPDYGGTDEEFHKTETAVKKIKEKYGI